ncbi:MAG: phenylalanine--tRNA ligase subunit alpha [Candidatus Omnitrophota bacterium]|nr:MAG: phenylalanine--tRNA ligase subunit alpha [Candidatus Omnitrophota bacterium]
MEEKLKNLEEEFNAEYQRVVTFKEVECLKVKYLGRKSQLNRLFTQLPTLAGEERGMWGRRLNSLKVKITSLLEEKLKRIDHKEQRVDLTFPSTPLQRGRCHILSTVNEKICSIFENLGFVVIEGKEVEDEWHNFAALNIPLEHPSRDVFDTFYLDLETHNKGKNRTRHLLRSHTSPSQIRVMRQRRPPLAVISPGRVYRPDEVDASHSFMFHQIEGFAVGEDINFSHLKGVLLYFARSFFSPDVHLRFRPHFFPFTEPSAEVDISCIICRGHSRKKSDNKLKVSGQQQRKCSVCKGKGWLEILGCGMIHPKVLAMCGIDFSKYRGFAFGMGVDRIAMLKYGIDDIRLFYENDTRFLEQF